MMKKTEHKKRKISAAAMLAAALAAIWLVLEVVLFLRAMPTAATVSGDRFCTTQYTGSGFTVDAKKSIYFSEECGAVQRISFTAGGQEDMLMTVTVAGYRSQESDAVTKFAEEKIAVGNREMVKNSIRVNIPEEAGVFYLSFHHDGDDYNIDSIVFNEKADVRFNFGRLLIVWSILALLVLVKHYKLFSVVFDPTKKSHGIAALGLCVFAVLIAVIMTAMLCPNTDKTTAYPFKHSANYYNPYEQQFDAFAKGQLHIDYAPSEELLALENPYDPDQREGVSYMWDRALYDGKYYSYFGIGPIIAVYTPYYLLTGKLPAYDTVSTVFAILTALFLSMAAVKWAAMYTKKLPVPVLWIGTVAAVFASQIFLMMRGHTRFYYIAIFAAMAFLSAFIWLLLCGISGGCKLCPSDKKQKLWKRPVIFAFAGVAYGLCFLSRLNMALLAAFFIVPALWFGILTEKRDGKRTLRKKEAFLPEMAALAAPVVIAVAVQLVLNYLRFDSFFEFGTTYQLTVSDISKNKLRLTDITYALYHYFLQPLKLNKSFPFVSLFFTRLSSYGHYVYVDTGMGMLVIPMMWALFAAPAVMADGRVGLGRKIALGATLVGMVAVALLDFCLGGVIFRYTCDLTLVGAFASMAVIFAVCDRASHTEGSVIRKYAVDAVAIGLMLVSICVCICLAFSLNANLSPYSSELYIALGNLFSR